MLRKPSTRDYLFLKVVENGVNSVENVRNLWKTHEEFRSLTAISPVPQTPKSNSKPSFDELGLRTSRDRIGNRGVQHEWKFALDCSIGSVALQRLQ
jgi:hypothetical protein